MGQRRKRSEIESDCQIRCCSLGDCAVSGSRRGVRILHGSEMGLPPLQRGMSNDESASLVWDADHDIPNWRPILLSGVDHSALAESLGLGKPEPAMGASPSA